MIKFQDPDGNFVFSLPEEHVKFLPRKGDLVYEKAVGVPVWKVVKVHHVITGSSIGEVIIYVEPRNYR